jgi:hypothetical protein
MRRLLTAGLALVTAVLVAAPPAAAAPATASLTTGGWIPAPSAPWDQAAGVTCDFAIHGDPIVDEVRKLVLETNPDGSPRKEFYEGALVIRLTNKQTGAYTDVDAGGSALVEFFPDGSMTWYAVGPVMVGFRENAGTLPRGQWRVDGVYRIEFTPTYNKTITMVYGTTHNACTDID